MMSMAVMHLLTVGTAAFFVKHATGHAAFPVAAVRRWCWNAA